MNSDFKNQEENQIEDFGQAVPDSNREDPEDCEPDITENTPTQKGSKKLKDTKFIQYSQVGDSFVPCGKTATKLKTGIYKILRRDDGMPIYEPSPVKSDEWLTFRDSLITDVTEEIEKFWDRRKIFKQYGYLQRRGYMFYGPPGTGKTVLLKQIIQRIIERDGVVFLADNHPDTIRNGLKYFAQIEPDRNIVCVFEDIDAIVDRYGESNLLSLLDGEDSVDHVLNLSSTNYPEKLDKRLIGRPRRFDRIIKIGYPEPDMRLFYFTEKLKVSEKEAKEWVDATEDFTFAAMTELVISVKCLGNSFEKSVKRIRNLLDLKPNSSEFNSSKMGF